MNGAGETPAGSIASLAQRSRLALIHDRRVMRRDRFLVLLCQADASAMEGRAKLRHFKPPHRFIGTSHLVFHCSKSDRMRIRNTLQTSESVLFAFCKSWRVQSSHAGVLENLPSNRLSIDQDSKFTRRRSKKAQTKGLCHARYQTHHPAENLLRCRSQRGVPCRSACTLSHEAAHLAYV